MHVLAYPYRMFINKGMAIYYTVLIKKEKEPTKNYKNHEQIMILKTFLCGNTHIFCLKPDLELEWLFWGEELKVFFLVKILVWVFTNIVGGNVQILILKISHSPLYSSSPPSPPPPSPPPPLLNIIGVWYYGML